MNFWNLCGEMFRHNVKLPWFLYWMTEFHPQHFCKVTVNSTLLLYIFCCGCRKGPLVIVNSVAMYEIQLTWKSLSNQAAFCWSMWQMCVKNLWGEIFHYTHVTDTKREEIVEWSIYFGVFLRTEYSRCFIKLHLNHWSHMDYFNNVLTTFLGLERGCCVAVNAESESSWISSKIS